MCFLIVQSTLKLCDHVCTVARCRNLEMTVLEAHAHGHELPGGSPGTTSSIHSHRMLHGTPV